MVEFAASLPLLLLIMVGITEMGRAMLQTNAIEKGMRVGAIYAARVENPTGAAASDVIENLVKTGTVDGSGAFLVEGWADGAAVLNIVQTSYNLDGENIPVITLNVSVPFDPILPGIASFVGQDSFTINLSHEQAYVDN